VGAEDREATRAALPEAAPAALALAAIEGPTGVGTEAVSGVGVGVAVAEAAAVSAVDERSAARRHAASTGPVASRPGGSH